MSSQRYNPLGLSEPETKAVFLRLLRDLDRVPEQLVQWPLGLGYGKGHTLSVLRLLDFDGQQAALAWASGLQDKEIASRRMRAATIRAHALRIADLMGTDTRTLRTGLRALAAAAEALAPRQAIDIDPGPIEISGWSVPWQIIARGVFAPEQIQCSYTPGFHDVPSEIVTRIAAMEALGDKSDFWNGLTYKLTSFDVTSSQMVDDSETNLPRLNFCDTDYYTELHTDLGHDMKDHERLRYTSDRDMARAPIQEFATILGVNLVVRTSDNFLLVSRRSRDSAIAAGVWHSAVHEHLLRPNDAAPSGAPDLWKCAQRALDAELGLVVSDVRRALRFNAFGVYSKTCQYSVLGTYTTDRESGDLIEAWRLRSRETWEADRLRAIPVDPDAVAATLCGITLDTDTAAVVPARGKDSWFPIGAANLIVSALAAGVNLVELQVAVARALRKRR